MFPRRTYCDVLIEMRALLDNISFYNYKKTASVLKMLTEECQVYGNRMEAGLGYEKDLHKLHEKRKKLLKELNIMEGGALHMDIED